MELHYSMVRQYQVGIRCIIAIIFDERYCPRGLQGLNYVKLSHGDLDEDEIEALIDRLSLGRLYNSQKDHSIMPSVRVGPLLSCIPCMYF